VAVLAGMMDEVVVLSESVLGKALVVRVWDFEEIEIEELANNVSVPDEDSDDDGTADLSVEERTRALVDEEASSDADKRVLVLETLVEDRVVSAAICTVEEDTAATAASTMLK
jgi:hypothetical protein